MTLRACGIAVALLFLSLTVPVLGKNYSLHSPKLWSPQEKEQIEKEQEPHKKQSRQVKKAKVPVKKDQILIRDGVSYREVTVQKGDTLYGIARKYSRNGSSYAEILQFNGIEDPGLIDCGDIIKIPVSMDRTTKQRNPAKQINPVASVLPKQQSTARPSTQPLRERPLSDVKQPEGSTNEISAAHEQNQLPQPAEKAIVKPPHAQAPPVPATTGVLQSRAFSNSTTPGKNLFEQGVKSYRQDDCQTAIQLFGRFLAENPHSILAADVSVFIADCYLKLSGK